MASLAVVLLATASPSAAQDRVILFEPFRKFHTSGMLPGEIREIEITQGGRGWSVIRTVELPTHSGGPPVALADGSRILWLAQSDRSTVLVQYEVATARASIVDIGRFHGTAFLLEDRTDLRVFIIEPSRITVLDARLRPESMALPGPKQIEWGSAYVADEHLFVKRYSFATSEAELVVIDTKRLEVVRTMPLTIGSRVLVSRNGQRMYHRHYDFATAQHRLDLVSLATGEVLARVAASPTYLFELDETRAVLIHDQYTPDGRTTSILARDAATLAVVGELGPRVFDRRRAFTLRQARREGAILMFSLAQVPGYMDTCDFSSPRIDVFDGTTFGLLNRIDLQGRCPAIVPLPRR